MAANPVGNAACRERLWLAVSGQGRARVLMRHLCCGRSQNVRGQILEMSRWFGTEGSVVQIHSPRPIPQKSSEICRVQSGSSLGFDAQIGSREPSAQYFKRWPSEELFDISSGASLVAGSVAHSSAQRSDSNLYAHLMLIAPTGGLRRSSTSTRARLESRRCSED